MTKYIATILLFLVSNLSMAQTYVTDINDGLLLSQKTQLKLLVVFKSDSCVFCKTLENDIEKGFLTPSDNYIVCLINTSDNKDLSTKYDIKTIPDSRIFVNNTEHARMIGYERKKYDKWLKKYNK